MQQANVETAARRFVESVRGCHWVPQAAIREAKMKYLLLGAITESGQRLSPPDLEPWMAEIG